MGCTGKWIWLFWSSAQSEILGQVRGTGCFSCPESCEAQGFCIANLGLLSNTVILHIVKLSKKQILKQVQVKKLHIAHKRQGFQWKLNQMLVIISCCHRQIIFLAILDSSCGREYKVNVHGQCQKRIRDPIKILLNMDIFEKANSKNFSLRTCTASKKCLFPFSGKAF